jgi:phosphatidylserine decarboxylase
VFYLAAGDVVRAGDRYGIVKFGSRMDVIVPVDFEFDIRPGERTVAGETVIGRLPAPTSSTSRRETEDVASAGTG